MGYIEKSYEDSRLLGFQFQVNLDINKILSEIKGRIYQIKEIEFQQNE